MSKRNLTLVIPDLLHFTQGQLTLPALQTYLRYATRAKVSSDNYVNLLFELFNIPLKKGGNYSPPLKKGGQGGGFSNKDHTELPIAAISALGEGLAAKEGCWLRADPVQLYADFAAVYLLGNMQLQVTTAEADALVSDIQRTLMAKDMTLHAPDPKRWYLQLSTDPKVSTSPLFDVINKEISHYLPKGKEESTWRRLFTEIQMLLHNHPVNQGRSADGKLSINGVWFWGIGELPKSTSAVWKRVWTDNPLTRGLCELSGTAADLIPTKLEPAQQMAAQGEYLIVIEKIRELWVHGAAKAWEERVYQLVENCFAPILPAVQDRFFTKVTLYPGDGYSYQLTTKSFWRWWRRWKK